MKRKKVTMGDIAEALGISKNAVSLALAGKEGISETLRKQVLQKADEMHYEREEKAQGTIIALIPRRIAPAMGSGFFYQSLCFEMETYARKLGYLLILCSVSEEEEDALLPHPILRQIPCVGVLTIGNFSKAYCKMIQDTGLRYAMVDQYYDSIAVDSVNTDNSSAGYVMTEHLIQMGHKNIQFFGPARKTSSQADRWNGYKRAMRDYGLPILHNPFIDVPDKDSVHEYEFVKSALDALPELPTAFVCGHDLTAKHVMDILAQRGLHCPEDFSLVGFDNIQNPNIAPTNLTSYRTPIEKIAVAAVEMVLDDRLIHPHRTLFFGEIIYRGSVRKINQ